MLRKHLYSSVIAMIIAIGVLLSIHQSGKAEEAKTSENTNIKLVHIDETMKEFYELHKSVKNEKIKEEKPKRPKLDVPNLSESKLDYLFKRTTEENLSYELLLSIFMLESEQGTKKIHYNSNGSVDLGVFQINSGTIKGLAKEAGFKSYDAMNDYTSMDLAIQHLKDSREYWIAQGMSEEEAYPYIIVNYNRGLGGTKAYLKHHDIEDNAYFQRIKKYKTQFELEENQ